MPSQKQTHQSEKNKVKNSELIDVETIEITQLELDVKNQQKQNLNQLQKKKQIKNKHTYLAHIDGLRAISIMIVLIFHAWPDALTGGYIGVDIFFVISGYLISGIIIKQTKQNKFSYRNFYQRRIKRIFPSLIVVLLFCLVVGCAIYMYSDLRIMAITMAASTAFGANIEKLVHKTGYWQPDSRQNPLLHLWSLGVQQQFYIIWPLIITFMLKFSFRKSIIIMLIFSIFSFAVNIISVYQQPQFAFYFPVCRFWQMSVGGILVYSNFKLTSHLIKNILPIIAIASISICVWVMNERSLFPGWWALIPTFSAVSIILAGQQSIVNKYVLSSKPFVFIGKISYSLYLWHWPLLAFTRYMYPSTGASIFSYPLTALIISFMLTLIFYHYVQNPLRFNKSNKVVFILGGIMILILLLSIKIALTPQPFSFNYRLMQLNREKYQEQTKPQEDDLYVNKNNKKVPNSSKNRNRITPTKQKIDYSTISFQDLERSKYLITEKSKYWSESIKDQYNQVHVFDVINEGQDKKVFLIGDSHAIMGRFRFNNLFEEYEKKGTTNEFPTVVTLTSAPRPYISCNPFVNFTMDLIRKHKPQKVLFIQFISAYLRERAVTGQNRPQCKQFNFKQQNFVDAMSESLKQIIDLGIDVYVATASPDNQNSINPNLMNDFSGVKEDHIKPLRLSQYRQNANKNWLISLDYFENKMKSIGVKLIDFSQNQCWQDICQVLTPSGYPIFRDFNHFTQFYHSYWTSVMDQVLDF